MKDISIQQKRQSCSETQKQCFISDEDKTQIINACHNQMKCTKPIKINSKCLYTTEYAYYNISYKCSNDNRTYILYIKLIFFVTNNEPTTNGRKKYMYIIYCLKYQGCWKNPNYTDLTLRVKG